VSFFVMRGALMISASPLLATRFFRVAPHALDAALFASALLLAAVVHQYPFVHAWLTVKIVALAVYIVLGSVAIRRGRTMQVRLAAFFSALVVAAFIVSVARHHDPLGALSLLRG
jgi:uncharacterized membrane protein SirB2